MSDKNFVFIWVFILGAMMGGQVLNLKLEQDHEGNEVIRSKWLYALILFLPVIWMTCFGQLRNDMGLYMSNYSTLPSTLDGALQYFNSIEDGSGKGFLVFELIIKVLTGGDQTIFRVILALAHSIPIIYVYRKYSPNYGISIYLFIAYGCHLAWMMNGMRQFLACAIIFAATPWMLEKKNIRLILVILLAYTIHSSAIIMLPIVFLTRGEAWSTKTYLSLFACIVLAFIFSNVSGSFDAVLSGTEYAGTMSSMTAYGDDGVNPIRVLIVAVPMVLAFWGRRNLDKKDAMLNMCINMSVFTFAITLIAMVTSGIMTGRLQVYTNLYNFILLPELIDRLFTDSYHQLVSIAMVICFLLYYRVECGF